MGNFPTETSKEYIIKMSCDEMLWINWINWILKYFKKKKKNWFGLIVWLHWIEAIKNSKQKN